MLKIVNSNFTPYFMINVINFPRRDLMLVKGVSGAKTYTSTLYANHGSWAHFTNED